MEPFNIRKQDHAPVLLMLQNWEDLLQNKITAGFTTRLADSSGSKACNTALHVGDDPENVIQNRKKIAAALSFDFGAWTCAEQVHDRRIHRVTAADRGRGRLTRESAIQDTDGLSTNVPGILLTSFYADCVPLYFFDPEAKAIGLAHAGWKGTVLGIAEQMVLHMKEEYGTPPARLLTAIGPSIGACCYEVDERVAEKVKQLEGVPRDPKTKLPIGLTKKNSTHYDLDLKECNRQLMIKAGINPNHIEFSTMCTSCQSELFFSHRRDAGKTGRMASWIGLREG